MTDKKTPVVSLAEHGRWNLRDIPKGLRILADEIESGKIPAEMVAAVVMSPRDEALDVFAYGDVGDDLRTAGILMTGVNLLTS